ncbi:MAG TPA: hypothetical protein VM096_04330 [Vicinamibacterales bacterium]|nr:hypothetical protein [Vicinamibacterales bacterium]
MTTDISVIFVGDNGWTDMAADLPEERVTSAQSFHKQWWKGVTLYHRNGYKFEVEKATTEEPLPAFSKLLAATVHNPTVNVKYEFQSTGFYKIEDLKKAVHDGIAGGSKVLTQFHSADDLMARVAKAGTFDDIVEVLQYAATEVEIVIEEDE